MDERTPAEKEADEMAVHDAARGVDADENSTLGLSSLMFGLRKIHLEEAQIHTREGDGKVGFYVPLEHLGDEGEVGFVLVRKRVRSRVEVLENEMKLLEEKIDGIDSQMKELQISIEMDEQMDEGQRQKSQFAIRDFQGQLAMERDVLAGKNAELETEKSRGVEVWYSPAETGGRVLEPGDVAPADYSPPVPEDIDAERRQLELAQQQERDAAKRIVSASQWHTADLIKDLEAIGKLNVDSKARDLRKEYRQAAHRLDVF